MVLENIHTFCEEFTDSLFIDYERNSILLSVNKEYLDIISTKYQEYGYILVHMTTFSNNRRVTCVFMKS